MLCIANSDGLTCCFDRLVHDVGLEEESPTSPPGARGVELEGPIKLSSSEEEFPQDELSDPPRSPGWALNPTLTIKLYVNYLYSFFVYLNKYK